MDINYASLPIKHRTTFQNLLGVKFNRYTVVEYAGKAKNKANQWKCLCDCGNISILSTSELNRGIVQSCGCLLKDRSANYKNKYKTEYNTWLCMKQRCFNKKSPDYKNYGGRGIKVCKEWIN